MSWNKLSEEEANRFFERVKLKPLVPYVSSNTPRKSKCLVCNSIVYPRLGDVKKAKSCVKCQGKKTGESIRLSKSEVLRTANAAKIRLIGEYVNSKTPIEAKCLICKKKIFPTIGRIRQGMGCKFCGIHKSAKNRLISKEVALADFKKANLQVLGNYVNSGQPVDVLCLKCKTQSRKSYKDLKSGRRCYTCGRRITAEKKRLKSEYKREVSLQQDLEPVEEIVSVGRKSKFLCLNCKRTIEMRFSSIQRGAKCRFCSRTEIDPNEAKAYMRRHHLIPLEPFQKSANKWKCRCAKCRNIVYPTFNQVSTFGGGCRYCRSAGYNPKFEGHLYLIHSNRHRSFKVGISNIKARLDVHTRKGWTEVKRWDFEDGRIPPLVEELILTHVRTKWDRGWSVNAKAMPQGGHTETFSAEELSVAKVVRLIEAKIKRVLDLDIENLR